MKRVVLSAFLASMCLVPGLEAKAFRCLLQNTCMPPPCEFFRELKASKAAVRAIARVQALAVPAYRNGTSTRALRRAVEAASADVRKVVGKYTKCPGYVPARSMSAGPPPMCEIGVTDGAGNFQVRTLDQDLADYSSCAEIVEAEYASAQAEQALCQLPAGPSPLTVARSRASGLILMQSGVDSLEEKLFRYLSSCAPDANTSREIAREGLEALAKAAEKARTEWEAKRASQAAAVR